MLGTTQWKIGVSIAAPRELRTSPEMFREFYTNAAEGKQNISLHSCDNQKLHYWKTSVRSLAATQWACQNNFDFLNKVDVSKKKNFEIILKKLSRGTPEVVRPVFVCCSLFVCCPVVCSFVCSFMCLFLFVWWLLFVSGFVRSNVCLIVGLFACLLARLFVRLFVWMDGLVGALVR